MVASNWRGSEGEQTADRILKCIMIYWCLVECSHGYPGDSANSIQQFLLGPGGLFSPEVFFILPLLPLEPPQ
jgi:hypothetical protein